MILGTVRIDICAREECFIKHDQQAILSLSDYCSSRTKRNVDSFGGIDVHNTVADSEVGYCLLTEVRSKPKRKAFLIYCCKWQLFNLIYIKIDGAIIGFDMIFVLF